MPTPYPGPAGRGAVERDLTRRASSFTCEPWRNTSELAFDEGALGAIWCGRPAQRVRQMAIYSFPSPLHVVSFWPQRLREIQNLPAEWGEDACVNGDPAVGTWAQGDIVCYVDDGVAKIRWTDHRSGLYGLVDATNRDLPALFAWWRSNGQRLGVADWAD